MTRTPHSPLHIVVNGWFWGQLATGSGQYLQLLAHWLPQVGSEHTYTLVVPGIQVAGRTPHPAPRTPHAVSPPGWQVHPISTPFKRLDENLSKLWFEQIAFPMACRRLPAHVALVPYWGSPWWLPCRTAVTVHDLIPLLLPAYRGGPLQAAYTRLVSATALRADVVLTDSRASREDIIQHLDIPGSRVHAVPLAAGEHFSPAIDEAELARVCQAYDLPGRFILYLGGFDARKNVLRLIQAYARYLRHAGVHADTPRLVIAGRLPASDTAFAPDPRPMVAQEGIAPWVHFTGWIDEADKAALYTLAAVFAFPSLYEGFGLPVAEAAACGTPVVTSNRTSLPEAAPGALLANPEDVGDIAAGLMQALKRSKQPPPASIRYTWRDVAAATLSILEG